MTTKLLLCHVLMMKTCYRCKTLSCSLPKIDAIAKIYLLKYVATHNWRLTFRHKTRLVCRAFGTGVRSMLWGASMSQKHSHFIERTVNDQNTITTLSLIICFGRIFCAFATHPVSLTNIAEALVCDSPINVTRSACRHWVQIWTRKGS